MNPRDIQSKRTRIVQCIGRQQINQAIDQLSELIQTAAVWPLRERLEQVKMSYNFMLQYLAKGVLDPKRDDVLNHIVTTLHTLVDECSIVLLEKDSAEIFYVRRRELAAVTLHELLGQYKAQLNKLNLLETVNEKERDNKALLQIVKNCEQCETNIFNKIWSTFPLAQNDTELLGLFLTDANMPEPARCLMIMALFLGLMRFYDENKLMLLIDAYATSTSSEVQLRAIIAVLLAMNCHRQRVAHSRNLQSHIDAMTEVASFADDVATVQYRLISTRNTDRVSRRVTQDIMPDIMKASPEMMRKLRDRKNDIEIVDFEENPEWQQMLEDSGIAKRMEEFNKLQQEGSDVFISTFSRLKTFPFFNTLSNWFMPYHNGHSVVKESFGDDERLLRDMVAHAPYLCNSDRFSFCLTLRSVPDSQRRMMMSQTQQQLEELKEMQKDSLLEEHAVKRDTIATRCVQDLYRFFKLFSRRHEFLAVMDSDMDFMGLPYLADYTDNENVVSLIAEFYLKNGFDKEAIKYFNRLLEIQEMTNPIVFQKLGFAHERLGNISEALNQYRRYELANEDDLWTLKHIANCYRASKQTDMAIKYFERVELLRPGQVANTLNMGHTLLEGGYVERALKFYFKADVMDDSKHRAWRPIAWCSFLLGNDERSRDYYGRVIESGEATANDYLNRGHVNLCSGCLPEAIEDYRQALSKNGNDVVAFERIFMADSQHLSDRGVSLTDIRLILDAVTNNN